MTTQGKLDLSQPRPDCVNPRRARSRLRRWPGSTFDFSFCMICGWVGFWPSELRGEYKLFFGGLVRGGCESLKAFKLWWVFTSFQKLCGENGRKAFYYESFLAIETMFHKYPDRMQHLTGSDRSLCFWVTVVHKLSSNISWKCQTILSNVRFKFILFINRAIKFEVDCVFQEDFIMKWYKCFN